MVRFVCVFMLLLCGWPCVAAPSQQLCSPDGKVKLEVTLDDTIRLSVFYGDESIVSACPVFLNIGGQTLGARPRMLKAIRGALNENIRNVVPLKQATTWHHANSLLVKFSNQYQLELRAYDNGVAWRFVLNKKGMHDISGEGMRLNLAQPCGLHISKTAGFWTSYENAYTHIQSADYGIDDEMSYLPVLMETSRGTKVLFSESDVRDYPHMFLHSTGNHSLSAVFPPSPETWEPVGDRGFQVTGERSCIARTQGNRTLPWRFLVVGDDATIVSNEMERVLGGRCELDDTSWIKPGKVSWDWWNHWTIWNVDFHVGINNRTYQYCIDFAANYGLEYILLDEGWCKDVRNPFVTRDEIDVRQLVDYGRQRGVGVFLWLTWLSVEEHFDVIKHYADMGVKGLKIDFMDHSDQWMVNYYERVAKECARHHLLVDFHGSFKPAGLEIRYPNVISYEGVRGMEQGGGCHPDNTIWLPFLRNAVGAMDFTPGSMQSAHPEDNHGTGSLPMGSGTRAYQMALYVVFESGLQMLADSPTRYMREDECTRFIASVPTTWDETRVLSAKAGSHFVVARRKGSRWFVGAITGSKPQHLNISLSFLGHDGNLTAFRDGVNANRIAVDYRRVEQNVSPTDTLTLELARDGGWCGVIE